MPDLGSGLLGCYRCAYVWRLRKSPVRMCPRCKSTQWNVPRPVRRSNRRSRQGGGIEEILGDHRQAFLKLARSFGASKIRVFGSVARGEAGPKSDLDLLVEFRRPLGVLSRAEFEVKIEALLGRPVDLATEEELHWLVRPRVLSEAVPV
ncbi:MAG: nucleotidyltransferase family protein [Thermoplasmata archaeon]|nr:nucleotidyltransferase family protein [Thermoplasmata archaeon]